ncbi:hypothetical protein RQP46_001049 [Phenoliferia psychrophenolica]
MAQDDPFPGLELCDLDFTIDALAELPSFQLALAPFSTHFPTDDLASAALDKKIIKLIRQRREKNRARIGGPVGVHAKLDQPDDRFPFFECIDLGWDLNQNSLKDLTSAQLVTNKDLIDAAGDLYYARREKSLSAGLSILPLKPDPPVEPQAPKPTPATPRNAGPVPLSQARTTSVAKPESSNSRGGVATDFAAPPDDAASSRKKSERRKDDRSSEKRPSKRAREDEVNGDVDDGRGAQPPQRNYGDIPPDSAMRLSRFASRPLNWDDDLPADLRDIVTVLYISNVSRIASLEQVRTMLLGSHQIAPVGLKLVPNTATRSMSTNNEIWHCFAAYLLKADALIVRERIAGRLFMGEIISGSLSTTPLSKRPAGTWRWSAIDQQFRDNWAKGLVRLPLSTFASHVPGPPPEIAPVVPVPTARPPPAEEYSGLPAHSLLNQYWQLFVSNLPADITMSAARDYFDRFDGLIGISLGTPNTKWRNCSAWLLFESKEAFEHCRHDLVGVTYPGQNVRLFLEDCSEKNAPKKKRDWKWLELEREFRRAHYPQRQPEPSSERYTPLTNSNSVTYRPKTPPETESSNGLMPPPQRQPSGSSSQSSQSSARYNVESSRPPAGPVLPIDAYTPNYRSTFPTSSHYPNSDTVHHLEDPVAAGPTLSFKIILDDKESPMRIIEETTVEIDAFENSWEDEKNVLQQLMDDEKAEVDERGAGEQARLNGRMEE